MSDVVEAVVKQLPGTEEILKGALVKLIEGLQSGTEFAKEQIPEVLRQMVVYNMIYAAFIVIVTVVSITVFALIMRRVMRPDFAIVLKLDREEPWYAGLTISAIVSVVMLIPFFLWALPTLLATVFAPKAWLVDKLLHAIGAKSIL